jgi:trigger factor
VSQIIANESVEELTNDKIHVSIRRKPSCRIELTVKASPTLIAAARRTAIKSLNKEVLIPGFRKGKAPEEMIAKKFPKEIEKEHHRALADAAFLEAQTLAKIPVLNRTSNVTFDLKQISPESAELFFSFETEPLVPPVDPKLFHPQPTARPPVGEVQIEEAIRQMRFFFADWKTIVDRPIQEGDYILIDLDIVEEDKVQKVFNQIRFEVSPARMAAWMQKLVIGAKAGDVLEGMSEPDADATEAEKQEFLPKKVRITIYKIEEASLPELNDEFAKKVKASNVEEMRQLVTQMLNSQADEKEQEELRGQITQFLIEQYPFEIPESLTKAEKEHRHQEMMKNPKLRKEWEKLTPQEKEERETKMMLEARNSVALFYLSRQVVNDAKISITHNQVQEEAIATLERSHANPVEVDKIPREVFAFALSKIMLAKAQDHILEAQKKLNTEG